MERRAILGLSALAVVLMACFYRPVNDTSVVHLGGSTFLTNIEASRSCIQRGDTIHLYASLMNSGSQARVIELRKHPVLDILVVDNGVASHWSDNRPLTPELTHLELAPGQTKTIDWEWNKRPTGSYVIFCAEFIYTEDPVRESTPGVEIAVQPCGWF